MKWTQIMERSVIAPLYRELSKQYVDADYVEYINLDEKTDDMIVHAKVNVLGYQSSCMIRLADDGTVEEAHCSCGQCEKGKACPHVGAVLKNLELLHPESVPYDYENPYTEKRYEGLLKIKEQIEQKKLREDVQDSRIMMEYEKEQYYKKIQTEIQEADYVILPTMECDLDDLKITYRVGKDKFYIIKNIEDFIERFKHDEVYRYGKNLEFAHRESAFDEDSRQQIQFMREVINNNKISISDSYYYERPEHINRYMYLEETLLDAFFDVYVEISGSNFECVNSEDQLHVSIHETDKTYVYTWDNQGKFMAGNHHLYRILKMDDFTLERYELDTGGKTLRFLKHLMKKPLVVLKTEHAQFYKFVISDIESFINIDSHVELPVMNDLIKVYADINDHEQVYVKLDYYNEEGDRQKGFDEHALTSYQQDLAESIIRKYADVIDYDAHTAFFDSESEAVYEFIYEGLTKLAEFCEIYVSDALKKLGDTHSYSISVGVRLKNDLLEIDIESLDIPKEELAGVLRAYRRRKKFYRLKNGQLLNLKSDELDELNQFMEDYHIGTDKISDAAYIPAYRMLSLDEQMDESQNLCFERDTLFQDKIKNWHQKTTLECIPKKYDAILRDYQKYGFQWLSLLREYGFNGILADDMGLGKTLQIITLLESMAGDGTSIVICPASLIYNWDEEVHKFTSALKTCCICGSADERILKINSWQDYDLMITSYDYMRRDIEHYENKCFSYVILDEAQNIKNQKTKNAMSVKKLEAEHKLALTGTPIENSLAELWSIFDFLMPDYLYNYHYFQSHYENDIVKNNDEEKQKKLKRLVSPFILRRNKKDVLKELPEKIEKNYLIDFNEEEYKLYLANLAQVNEQLGAMVNGEQMDKIAILAMLTKLRQICCEPRLLYENIEQPSSKFQACMDLIKMLRDNHQKILLFSAFTSVLDLLSDELYKEGISYYMLTGKTSKEDRRKLVTQFQNDQTTIFLISLKAGGTGLNLTAAEAVIHYDPWWNQSAQNQATDRAHRIGQTKSVQVFKLIMKNSIEEKILKLQLMKKELADMFVENNEGSIAKMSKEEILELFKL